MEFVEGEIRELGPGVFIREAVDNCVWADLGDGVVVIDALEDAGLAPVIQQAIAETVGKPMRWLINTHWHGDHIACNRAWARAGATVIAHESCGRATNQRDGQPDINFKDRYVLQGAERQAELEWLGGTHTPADTVVYFRWAKVLHVADLFGWGLFPLQEINPRTVARMREVIQRVLSYDAGVVIPGHGPTLTLDHLRRWLAYFDDMLERVPELKAERKSVEQIAQAAPPPGDMQDWWRFVAWKHRHNIEQIVRFC